LSVKYPDSAESKYSGYLYFAKKQILQKWGAHVQGVKIILIFFGARKKKYSGRER
jgi:hypothetical protein